MAIRHDVGAGQDIKDWLIIPRQLQSMAFLKNRIGSADSLETLKKREIPWNVDSFDIDKVHWNSSARAYKNAQIPLNNS